jgi:nicotinate-nucleotide adenylyltransferase
LSSPTRIGVFGGTFDPVHNAHLDIARTALAHGQLDRVLFVVAARPPHKRGGPYATAEDRFALVEAAVAGQARFEASRIELDREGPSYSVLTLQTIQDSHPSAELFLVIGQDSLVDLPEWYDAPDILERAQLLVLPRPGEWTVPETLDGTYTLLPFEKTGVSSTEVRARVAKGRPIDTLVPDPVAILIESRGMYRVGDTPSSAG